jgi:hypothetical protein
MEEQEISNLIGVIIMLWLVIGLLRTLDWIIEDRRKESIKRRNNRIWTRR